MIRNSFVILILFVGTMLLGIVGCGSEELTEEKPEVSTVPSLGKEDLLGSWKLISIFGTIPAAYLESLTIGGETEVTIKQFDYVFYPDDQWTVNYASETVAIFSDIPRTNITLGGTWSGTWVFDGLTLSLNVEDDGVEVAADPKDIFERLEQTEEELKQTYNENFRADFLKPFEKSTCTKQADTLILITSAGEKMVLGKQ